MELHGDNCSRNGVIQQRLQHLWSYARREQQIRRYRPFNDPVTPKMLLSLRITPFLLHSAKMLKWEGSADQREAAARRRSPSMAPLVDARPTHSARSPQSMRAAPLGMSPTTQRSPHETARVERANRCRLPDLSTFGHSMGIKRSRRKSASVPTCAFPAHRAASTPTLPFKCPKVENASRRAGNRTRNPARCPLEALGGDASPPQRSPSARAGGRTPA